MRSSSDRRRGRWARATVAAVVTIVGGFVAGAGLATARPSVAAAHTRITGTAPADASVVDAPPPRVTVRLAAKPGTIEGDPLQVYDPSGRRVDLGDVRVDDGGAALSVGVAGGGHGRYDVLYRIVSADSHVIAGSFGFTVGAPGERLAAAAGTSASAGTRDGAATASAAGTHGAPVTAGSADTAGAALTARVPTHRSLHRGGPADLRPQLLTASVAGAGLALGARRHLRRRRRGRGGAATEVVPPAPLIVHRRQASDG